MGGLRKCAKFGCQGPTFCCYWVISYIFHCKNMVSTYETQLLLGQPNEVDPKFQGVVQNQFFLKLICQFIVYSAGSSGSTRMKGLVMSHFLTKLIKNLPCPWGKSILGQFKWVCTSFPLPLSFTVKSLFTFINNLTREQLGENMCKQGLIPFFYQLTNEIRFCKKFHQYIQCQFIGFFHLAHCIVQV